jgi:hypothetical protein
MILDMKLGGKTYEEISEEIGYSPKCIRKYIQSIFSSKRIEMECIYPGLKKYLVGNFDSIGSINIFFYPSGKATNTLPLRNKLNGKSNFTLCDIKKIIERSGKTFEYLFLMTEEEVEEYDRKCDV